MVVLALQQRRRGTGAAAQETTPHPASSASSSTPGPSRTPFHTTTLLATTLMALLLALLLLVPETCAWRVPSSPASQAPLRSSLGKTSPLFSTLPDPNNQQQPPQDDSSSSSSPSSPPVQVQSFSPFLGRQQRRPGLLFQEEIDFCLAIPTLEGVSVGNSNVEIAKVVNTFANQAAKKILIGFDCCFGDLADAVKERLRAEYAAPLEGGGEGGEGGAARAIVEGACGFIDAVAALSPCSDLKVSATKAALLPAYSEAYSRVVDTLLSNNCEFRSTSPSPSTSSSSETPAQNDGDLKILPRDRDICLSLYDTITGAPTKTKILNKISNRVSRTMLYGDEDDVAKLTTELTTGKASFVEEWLGGEEEGGAKCDESVYYDSLIAHLTGGLEAPAPAAMGGGYSNAYQRFMTLLVQELGTRSASVDPEMFDSFVRWESTLRKNLTQDMWDPHPKELTGQWTLMDSGPNPGSAASSAGSTGGKDKKSQRTANLVFRRDGTLRVPPELGLDGSWSFEPGPTHLDTIRFELRLGTPDNRILAYTGYVDRGQRIETRFSKRPIKMKGRVVLRVRGEPRSSSKFTMQLSKKNMLLENLVVGSTRGTLQE